MVRVSSLEMVDVEAIDRSSPNTFGRIVNATRGLTVEFKLASHYVGLLATTLAGLF